MLGMDIQEVRVVSVNDMRGTERQALHAFRKAHTEVSVHHAIGWRAWAPCQSMHQINWTTSHQQKMRIAYLALQHRASRQCG